MFEAILETSCRRSRATATPGGDETPKPPIAAMTAGAVLVWKHVLTRSTKQETSGPALVPYPSHSSHSIYDVGHSLALLTKIYRTWH